MKQRQDLGRAAPDVFVRLRRWSPSRLPRHTRMRHGLKGTGLVLTPDREPKLRQSPSCARAQAAPEPKLRQSPSCARAQAAPEPKLRQSPSCARAQAAPEPKLRQSPSCARAQAAPEPKLRQSPSCARAQAAPEPKLRQSPSCARAQAAPEPKLRQSPSCARAQAAPEPKLRPRPGCARAQAAPEPKLRQSPSCARAQAAPEPKLRPQRVGLLDQLFLARASGSRTRTTPCLRRRIATPVSHQVRLFCQLRPLACRAARMQRAPDRERADLRQPIRSVAQGSLQQAHGPGGRAVLLALGRAGPFGQDALLRLSAIADPWSAPMAPWPGRTAASPSRLKRLTQAEIVSLCRRPTWWAAAV